MSHLLQMRGLKLGKLPKKKQADKVASFTDAWIETKWVNNRDTTEIGRIFYRCVD